MWNILCASQKIITLTSFADRSELTLFCAHFPVWLLLSLRNAVVIQVLCTVTKRRENSSGLRFNIAKHSVEPITGLPFVVDCEQLGHPMASRSWEISVYDWPTPFFHCRQTSRGWMLSMADKQEFNDLSFVE